MNAIYLHSTDGFTFLENVPEKPKFIDDMYHVENCINDANFKAYERALAEAIEKRMVIGNPEVIEQVQFYLYHKEGEFYPWPHEWKYKFICSLDEIQCSEECHGNRESKLKCSSCKTSVILSPPKEENVFAPHVDPDYNPNSKYNYKEHFSKEQFNSPENQNRDKAIVGFQKVEPVNSSMSEKEGETENSTLPKELQPDSLAVEGSQVVKVIDEEDKWRWPAIRAEEELRKYTKDEVRIVNGKSDFHFGFRKALEWITHNWILETKQGNRIFDGLPEPHGKSEPVVSQDQEEQEEIFKDMLRRCLPYSLKIAQDGVPLEDVELTYVKMFMKDFTISRKPID